MNEVLQILIDCWKWDVAFYSQGWVYCWLLVPAMAYAPFMLIKWILLTCPLWLPFSIIFGSIKIGVRK